MDQAVLPRSHGTSAELQDSCQITQIQLRCIPVHSSRLGGRCWRSGAVHALAWLPFNFNFRSTVIAQLRRCGRRQRTLRVHAAAGAALSADAVLSSDKSISQFNGVVCALSADILWFAPLDDEGEKTSPAPSNSTRTIEERGICRSG